MRYGFQTRPLLSANLTYLDLGNLLLFCAGFCDTLPMALLYQAETKDRGVSCFTAPAFAGLLGFKRKSYLCSPEG